ncbi:MAG: acyl carrier protein [Pirellulales bacterium]
MKQVLKDFVGGTHEIVVSDKPISGLGLTSLDGVDFACELEKQLGCSIPSKMNPFVLDGNAGERNVKQIVDAVSAICSETYGVTL